MSKIEEQNTGKKEGEIRYLTPLNIDTSTQKKYCRFKRSGIKYVDYKDPDFLLKFVNEQGKILPRRLTGTSLKYQRKVSVAIKRARHLALMPLPFSQRLMPPSKMKLAHLQQMKPTLFVVPFAQYALPAQALASSVMWRSIHLPPMDKMASFEMVLWSMI